MVVGKWPQTSNAEKEDCVVPEADYISDCYKVGAGEGLEGKLREPCLGDSGRIG